MENINRIVNKEVEVSRMEIRWVNLPSVEGSSLQKGWHPCVILQNNKGCKYSPNAQVCTLTSQTLKNRLPTQISISKDRINGLTKDSVIQVESVTNVPKFLIGELIGKITDDVIAKIDKAIAIQFGMKEVERFDINYVNTKMFDVRKLKELFELTNNSDLGILFRNSVTDLKNYCQKFNRDYTFFYNDNNDTINTQILKVV